MELRPVTPAQEAAPLPHLRVRREGLPDAKVPALAREGDLFVHADLTAPDRLAVSHVETGRKLADAASLEDARALIWDANRPELRAILDRAIKGDTAAGDRLAILLQVGEGTRIERQRRDRLGAGIIVATTRQPQTAAEIVALFPTDDPDEVRDVLSELVNRGVLAKERRGVEERYTKAPPGTPAIVRVQETDQPRRAPFAGDGRPVVLVSCSAEKAKTDEKVPAAELYTSQLFKLSLAYARTLTDDNHIQIMSALHGLVSLYEPIAPYDLALKELDKADRWKWGTRVANGVARLFGGEPRKVVILGGGLYVASFRDGAGRGTRWMIEAPLEGLDTGHRLQWLNQQIAAAPRRAVEDGATEKARIIKFIASRRDEEADPIVRAELGAMASAVMLRLDRDDLRGAAHTKVRLAALEVIRAHADEARGPGSRLRGVELAIRDGEHLAQPAPLETAGELPVVEPLAPIPSAPAPEEHAPTPTTPPAPARIERVPGKLSDTMERALYLFAGRPLPGDHDWWPEERTIEALLARGMLVNLGFVRRSRTYLTTETGREALHLPTDPAGDGLFEVLNKAGLGDADRARLRAGSQKLIAEVGPFAHWIGGGETTLDETKREVEGFVRDYVLALLPSPAFAETEKEASAQRAFEYIWHVHGLRAQREVVASAKAETDAIVRHLRDAADLEPGGLGGPNNRTILLLVDARKQIEEGRAASTPEEARKAAAKTLRALARTADSYSATVLSEEAERIERGEHDPAPETPSPASPADFQTSGTLRTLEASTPPPPADDTLAPTSDRAAASAPCATEEGVLAATLGEYRTPAEIAAVLGCDVAGVQEVLAGLHERHKVRRTFNKHKPERWGHDVPPWNEDWAVHRDGERIYGDTSFLTAAGQLPGFSVRHLGFGEFTLDTPEGEVEFNRFAGVDFPGQTGRSHLLEGTPEALALLLREMRVEERLAEGASSPPPSLAQRAATLAAPPAGRERGGPPVEPADRALEARGATEAPDTSGPTKATSRTLEASGALGASETSRTAGPARARRRVSADPVPGDEGKIRLGDGEWRSVPVLAREGDFFVHEDTPGFFTVTHVPSGLSAGTLGTLEEARAAMFDLDAPEVRSLLDRSIAGDKSAPRALEKLRAQLLPSRFDRFSKAEAEREAAIAQLPMEQQGVAARTKANLAAMNLAAELRRSPRALTDEDRVVLAQYSGWGGLSIRKAETKFPSGFPRPEDRGLIHEYYTPSRVCREVARIVAPLLPALADADGGVVEALEPSAGIGRFVRAFEGPGFELMRWHAVEYSAVSAAMLGAMRPELDLFAGSFERWLAAHEAEYSGKLRLVVANPPYGKRGASKVEDPNPDYRIADAYAYFLRRGLDLLAQGGLGVFLIPTGFVSGTGEKHKKLRDAVLRRHHLAAAFRLPSGLFPGAHLVTDLVFFRARGVELLEVDKADQSILEGKYFEEYPGHILGKEVGKAGDDDDQTAKPRWGYQVVGEFTALPELRERPLCAECSHGKPIPRPKPKPLPNASPRATAAPDFALRLASASSLGQRVATFLAAVAAGDSEMPALAWLELHRGLTDWATEHGPPSLDLELQQAAKGGDVGAQQFLSAFLPRSADLIPALRTRPIWEPRYQGRDDDVLAKAEFLYRQRRHLAPSDVGGDVASLFAAGWCEDDAGALVPGDVYYSGELWPKYDRAKARAVAGDHQAATQARKLLELIKPALFDDIQGVTPRQGWVPIELVGRWMATFNHGAPVDLVRAEGLVQVKGKTYEELGEHANSDIKEILGWINHDRYLFRPERGEEEDTDTARRRLAKEWEQNFRAWCGADDERRTQIEHAYQRAFQGYRAPEHSAEPLQLARWGKSVRLRPWQNSGARRVLRNRGGLIAFDVGVGKTFTGTAVLAAARQEGWCKRPIILVPNGLIWKWERDIHRALPDYRVGIVGAKRVVPSRGPRKGKVTSDTDTPAERAQTWRRFQGGEFDVVLLTFTAMPRTLIDAEAVRRYAAATAAIERDVRLRQRNADKKESRGKTDLTERESAILTEGISAWVAEHLEMPKGWAPDPGVTWDEIGCDFLIIDEWQAFKNRDMPEQREGGVPRFMGGAGEGSKRAWQLDFRAAAVRRLTGGAGVVELTATPAKNSPLELYVAITQIDAEAFKRLGIYDSEQFIDRFCQIEMRDVLDATMEVVSRSAVVGFQNLDELRDVVFRYGEFKTADDVGLPLPEPLVRQVEVDMNAAQEAKYARYVADIEDALEHPRGTTTSNMILGKLARLALVAIHPDLDEGYTWDTANDVLDPHSPKFDALAKEVAAQPACGHIIFCDNVAAHAWVKMVLVEAGISAERIAVLNAEVAKETAERERIARAFNGDSEEGIAPEFDVIIANQVAYEGVDLQTRTCAIHHLDLPWEPATLEQRNGRGRRQGNTLATIQIIYYFARRSQDGLRFNLIQGKRGWMSALLKSQARETNNPGAQMDLSPEDVLLLISRTPEKTRERQAALREKHEAEARAKAADHASGQLRGAVVRFARARTAEPEQAAIWRSEAEQRLAGLARVDSAAWPWAGWALAARDHAMLVPPGDNAPVYEGLRVATPNIYDRKKIEYAEFGRVSDGNAIGLRAAGSPTWKEASIKEVIALDLQPEHRTEAWPDTDDAAVDAVMRDDVIPLLRRGSTATQAWTELGWKSAPGPWLERVWTRLGGEIVDALASSRLWSADFAIPVVAGGKLKIGISGPIDRAIAPTPAGWEEFLRLAPASGLKFTALEEVGTFWFGQKIPRGLLARARDEQGSPPSAAAVAEGTESSRSAA